MSIFNPFNLSGGEAVLSTAIACGTAAYIVRMCTRAAISMTLSITKCVSDSVAAWANAVKSKVSQS